MGFTEIIAFLKKSPNKFFCVKDIDEQSNITYSQITQTFYLICKKYDMFTFRKEGEEITPALYPFLKVKYLKKVGIGGLTRYMAWVGDKNTN